MCPNHTVPTFWKITECQGFCFDRNCEGILLFVRDYGFANETIMISICNWLLMQRLNKRNCHLLKYSSCKYWICLKELILILKGWQGVGVGEVEAWSYSINATRRIWNFQKSENFIWTSEVFFLLVYYPYSAVQFYLRCTVYLFMWAALLYHTSYCIHLFRSPFFGSRVTLKTFGPVSQKMHGLMYCLVVMLWPMRLKYSMLLLLIGHWLWQSDTITSWYSFHSPSCFWSMNSLHASPMLERAATACLTSWPLDTDHTSV